MMRVVSLYAPSGEGKSTWAQRRAASPDAVFLQGLLVRDPDELVDYARHELAKKPAASTVFLDEAGKLIRWEEEGICTMRSVLARLRAALPSVKRLVLLSLDRVPGVPA